MNYRCNLTSSGPVTRSYTHFIEISIPLHLTFHTQLLLFPSISPSFSTNSCISSYAKISCKEETKLIPTRKGTPSISIIKKF